MNKYFYSLGLMSGTSGDGVDASVIYSDGYEEYKVILDKYFKYDKNIYEKIHNIKSQINNPKDLDKYSDDLKEIEREITLFHSKAILEISKDLSENIDIISFHGQTIFHDASIKLSKQLGDGKLLSQLIKKTIIYNFRENDLNHGGQGAPLTPIFHNLLANKLKIKPATFLNLGGIANVTKINEDNSFFASDIGPGMCLIDEWIRTNSNYQYDDGVIGKSGNINKLILEQALDNLEQENKTKFKENLYKFKKPVSFDTKDFSVAFVRGLSLKDGAATLTEYTVKNIVSSLNFLKLQKDNIVLCGGGRKNKFLIDCLKRHNISLKFVDEYGIDGDFIESQAFAYLGIRSYLRLPISFPKTTGVNKPCLGGDIIKN